MERKSTNIVWRIFGSFEFSVVLLVLLGLLTWLGTLEQTHKGLYDVQKEYFESLFLVYWVGLLPIPLPGATLVMGLLFFNLLVGGVMRHRWRAQNAGILITHLGIALLLVAGFVKMTASVSGRLALFEGQRGAHFESFHDWELALLRKDGDDLTERTVPATVFRHADKTPVVIEDEALPFRLELTRYMDNCVLRQKGPMVPSATPVVDGVFLQPSEPFKENEINTAGVYATVVDGESSQTGILWGRDMAPFDRNRYPWTFEAAGATWGLELRRVQYPLPFAIELDKFIKEEHPGTSMPREFTSEVTVHEGRSRHQARITMNAPLRKEGFVAYQASWGPSTSPRGPWYSQFEIARNPSDQWPLYACIVIAAGLLLHFLRKLYRYITAENLKRTMQNTKAAVPLLLFGLIAAPAVAQHTHEHESDAVQHVRSFSWEKELVEDIAVLPIQSRGRVMPFSTYASFSLYHMHGRRDLKLGDGVKLSPTEWLLDVLFFPDMAADYPLFRIENRDSLTAIGLGHLAGTGLNFDFVSYKDMGPGMTKLEELWQDWGRKEDKDRTPLEQAVVGLADKVFAYQYLHFHFDTLRMGVPLEGEAMQALFGGRTAASFTEALMKRAELRKLAENGSPGNASQVAQRLEQIGAWGKEMGDTGRRRAPALFPPVAAGAERYLHVEDLAYGETDPRHMEMLTALERMAHAGHDAGVFQNAAGVLHARAVELAEARGDYGKVEQEVQYYALNLHFHSMWTFVLAFLIVAPALLFRRSGFAGKVLYWAAFACSGLALALLVGDITLRSILRDRPPITNLYDTFLFIGGTAVLVALIAEAINKRRVALASAPVIGAVSIVLARKFEVMRGEDTLHQLQAVLDSNFWLATHVTTINIGYAAGMLAAGLGSVYIVSRIVSLFAPVRQGYLKSVARMVYGVTCFGLVFAVVGTILGGIWANDSWGRFWGWDPKENGALLICIAQIAMLHGRMGGFLRDFGFSMVAAFTGTIVAFSWFHVNILGVGLHSYGFSGGLSSGLWTYYYGQWGLMALGGLAWLLQKSGAVAPVPPPVPKEPEGVPA